MQRLSSRSCGSAQHLRSTLLTGLAVCVLACGGAQSNTHTTGDLRSAQTQASSDSLPYGDLQVNPSASLLQSQCGEASYEQCNALDDDCNGIIDDDCGYEGGDVQVTVGWNSGADIDLYVTDPSGATLYYNEKHRRSRIGGHLDHDARGDCRKEQRNARTENAYWPSPAKPGKYRVELHYFSPCAHGSTTDATVSVMVDNQLLGAYSFRLEPEERIEALSFVKR